MAKSFSDASSDVYNTIERVRNRYHQHLADDKGRWRVTVGALFVFDLESSLPILKHQGYPAAAEIKITPLKERVLGIADAIITVDRSVWMMLNAAGREALIDHELYHLDPVLDDETGSQEFDAHSRPKLAARMHDAQIGAFHDVMRRHGKDAVEVRCIRQLLSEASQYNLDLFDGLKVPGEAPEVSAGGIKVDATGNVSGSGTLKDGTKFEVSGRVPVTAVDVDTSDEMYPKAVEFVQGDGKPSVSALQRHLSIGYNRGARLMEAMERMGIVSAMATDGTRQVLQRPPEPQGMSPGAAHH